MTLQRTVMAAIRLGLKTVEAVSLTRASAIAHHLWLRPMRIPLRPADQTTRDSAERFDVSVRGVTYRAESWGRGPVALLMHGWDGRASQMYGFIAPLLAAGYRVVTFDVPASGSAPGRQVDPLLAGDVVRAVVAHCGGIDTLVTHSFGSTWGLVGVTTGRIPVRAVVLISPPLSLRQIYDKFCARLALSARLRDALERRFRDVHGDLWTQFSNEVLVTRLDHARALVIHDEGDLEVPFAEGQALAACWPGAQLHRTRGLGHYRVLKSPEVIERTVRFLGAPAQAASRPARTAAV